MSDCSSDESEVKKANIDYHTALAETYDATQPHYKPENVTRVDRILANLAEQTGGGSLLDLGCGTGFLINIARKYFKRIVGVDITPAMLNLIDTSSRQVELCLSDTACVPLGDNEFDVCTAYGFLHHLYDIRPTLSEAFRCLKPSGIFYADQDPNCHYWRLMKELKNRSDLPEVIAREVRSVTDVSEDISTATGLTPKDVALAEYQKVEKGGFDPDVIVPIMREIGFDPVRCKYEWFLGQGKLLHEQSQERRNRVENYLREMLPATRHLFKYISFHGYKRS